MTNSGTPAARLRAIREGQGRGLRATAREAGIDPSRLSKLERGLLRPSLGELVRLGRVLDLPLVKYVEPFWDEAR
jgi:transcriptional regulator with XRE-family HTH domain